jgi:hypothetical protein
VFRSIGSALFDCRHLGPSTGPHWPAVLEGNIPLPFQFLPRVFDPPSLSSCWLLSRATPMGSIFCLARADRQSRQQQRDRDGDRRDEDQRLNTRHAPHRAPPIVSEMVHNLGRIVCMQIYSYGAVARSPRFGELSTSTLATILRRATILRDGRHPSTVTASRRAHQVAISTSCMFWPSGRPSPPRHHRQHSRASRYPCAARRGGTAETLRGFLDARHHHRRDRWRAASRSEPTFLAGSNGKEHR